MLPVHAACVHMLCSEPCLFFLCQVTPGKTVVHHSTVAFHVIYGRCVPRSA